MNAIATLSAGCPPSAELLAAVAQRARVLQQAAARGDPPPSLQGRFIGLVCEDGNTAEADLFRQAAAALGARVALVQPGLHADSAAAEVSRTARLLGRLYDALAFQGIDSRLVAQIGQHAGVPVFDGLAGAVHPCGAPEDTAPDPWAGTAIDDVTPPRDMRLIIVQAALLTALS